MKEQIEATRAAHEENEQEILLNEDILSAQKDSIKSCLKILKNFVRKTEQLARLQEERKRKSIEEKRRASTDFGDAADPFRDHSRTPSPSADVMEGFRGGSRSSTIPTNKRQSGSSGKSSSTPTGTGSNITTPKPGSSTFSGHSRLSAVGSAGQKRSSFTPPVGAVIWPTQGTYENDEEVKRIMSPTTDAPSPDGSENPDEVKKDQLPQPFDPIKALLDIEKLFLTFREFLPVNSPIVGPSPPPKSKKPFALKPSEMPVANITEKNQHVDANPNVIPEEGDPDSEGAVSGRDSVELKTNGGVIHDDL